MEMCLLNKFQRNKLNKILTDKISGSSEILNKINNFLIENYKDINIISESIPLIKHHLNHFAAINNYLHHLNEILKLNDKKMMRKFLTSFVDKEQDSFETIFNKLYKKTKKINNIITLSKSGTLKEVFKIWKEKNNNLKIVICESRPGNEGKLFAKELLKFGIKVELISDAMTALYVPQVDAAIIGADEILKNGDAINKVGSKTLALLCKEYKKPFYILTAKTKYSGRSKFSTQKSDPSELWNYESSGLIVSNIYFERIERKLITEVITN